jgi:Rod binding domain-containing protein
MNVQALDNPTLTATQAVLTRPSGAGFEARLRELEAQAADGADADGLAPDSAKTLRKAAEQLVATTFIQPMLAKMREDPFKSDLFHGGQTEEIFGQQLDTVLAERIVAKADFSIVDAVYNTIAKRSAPVAVGQGVDTHG